MEKKLWSLFKSNLISGQNLENSLGFGNGTLYEV